jgi:hypothetical protein
MNQSELNDESYFGPLLKMALEAGLTVKRGDEGYGEKYTVYFYEKGVKDQVAAVAVDFSFGYGYVRRGTDPTVSYFVVSGRYMPKRSSASRKAVTPWNYNYTRTTKLPAVFELLKGALRTEQSVDRIEREARECRRRWNCSEWERRRSFSTERVLNATVAEYRDGHFLPHYIMMDKEAMEEIVNHGKAIDRYISGWMAMEIIDISERTELEMAARGAA